MNKISSNSGFITSLNLAVLLLLCITRNDVALASSIDTKESSAILITNGLVIDVRDGSKAKQDIYIQDGKITSLYPHGSAVKLPGDSLHNARIVDGTGKYIIPGLWDIHVHLTNEPGLEKEILKLFVANGVTHVRDMGGPLEQVLALRQYAAQPENISPEIRIVGPILDGTPTRWGINRKQPIISIKIDTPEEAVKAVDRLASLSVDGIKPYDSLVPEVFASLAERAKQRGISVDGHVPKRVYLPTAIASGMRGVQHLTGMRIACSDQPQQRLAEIRELFDQYADHQLEYNDLLKQVAQIEDKAFGEQNTETCDVLIESFVENNVWHTPTLAIWGPSTFGFTRPAHWAEALPHIPRSMRLQMRKKLENYGAQRASAYGQWRVDITKKMHEKGVRLLAGTDTPSIALGLPGFSLHDELQALVQAGLSPLEALKTATLNPAQFFGVENQTGNIAVGYSADILILNADPLVDIRNTQKIDAVLLKGRLFNRDALSDLMNY